MNVLCSTCNFQNNFKIKGARKHLVGTQFPVFHTLNVLRLMMETYAAAPPPFTIPHLTTVTESAQVRAAFSARRPLLVN